MAGFMPAISFRGTVPVQSDAATQFYPLIPAFAGMMDNGGGR